VAEGLVDTALTEVIRAGRVPRQSQTRQKHLPDAVRM